MTGTYPGFMEKNKNGTYAMDNPLKEMMAVVLDRNKIGSLANSMMMFSNSYYSIRNLWSSDMWRVFENIQKLWRNLENEKQIVQHLLDGHRAGVVQLPFTPGSLLIFGGRQTIHRVTQVHGDVPRLVPVLCYAEQPDRVNSKIVRKLFWGRTGIAPDD